MTTPIALYLRVSTEDQTTANQLPELERYAATRGYQIVETYLEEGVSGSKESRPALDRLRQDAKAGKFSSVVCWKFDRVSRNTRHLLTLHEELTKVGVSLVSVTESIDTSTPSGKFTLTVMAGVAELERANLIERTKAGLARVRASGTKLGRPQIQFNAEEARALAVQHGKQAAAKLMGISVPTFYRRLAEEVPSVCG